MTSPRTPGSLSLLAVSAALLVATSGAAPARAELPTAAELLKDLGLTQSDAESARAGKFVTQEPKPSNERELTAGFAFLVKGVSPKELVDQARAGLLDKVDPDTLAVHRMTGPPTPADFAKFSLQPDGAKQARAFLSAKPGEALNLSSQEIAAFQKLGSGASQAQVEQTIRGMLLARLTAYREKGLAGIAPYARGSGKTRSPAEDLRSASQSYKLLEKYVPKAYQFVLDYPKGKPDGTEEVFRWSQIMAHGEPTLVLTHNLYIPDGDGWVVLQRQFYVSTGFNCEQAIAAFLPVKLGTAIFYGNRTSTDQVTGFGGGAKRSIGSKLLGSTLEGLFEKARKKAGSGG